jgi:hypothetical protein
MRFTSLFGDGEALTRVGVTAESKIWDKSLAGFDMEDEDGLDAEKTLGDDLEEAYVTIGFDLVGLESCSSISVEASRAGLIELLANVWELALVVSKGEMISTSILCRFLARYGWGSISDT